MIPEGGTVSVDALPTSEMKTNETSVTDLGKILSSELEATESEIAETISDESCEEVQLRAAEDEILKIDTADDYHFNGDLWTMGMGVDATDEILNGNELQIAVNPNVPLLPADTPSTENGDAELAKNITKEKKMIKISSFTEEERLQMRAKKFGVLPTANNEIFRPNVALQKVKNGNEKASMMHDGFHLNEGQKRKAAELEKEKNNGEERLQMWAKRFNLPLTSKNRNKKLVKENRFKRSLDVIGGEKRIIKISNFTPEERLQMRVKKFGLPLVRTERNEKGENGKRFGRKQMKMA